MKTRFLLFQFLLLPIIAWGQNITSDLEVHYKFDFTTGDTHLNDYSGNNRHLRPVKWGTPQEWNGFEWNTAEIGKETRNYVYLLPGRDSDVVLSNTENNHWLGIAGNQPRTIAAWIRIDAGANDNAGQFLLWYGNENQPGGCYKVALKGHSIELENAVNNAGNGWRNRNVAWLNDTDHPQDTWHHLALVFDGEGDRRTGLKLYFDGKELTFNPVNTTDADFTINTTLQYGPEIGRYMSHMALADYRIYSRALTLEEINLLRGDNEPPQYTIADLNTIIQTAISNNDTRVVIPPGVYRGKAPFITIRNVDDLEIVAERVTMLCETKVRAIQIENCSNLKLTGLTLDYNPLTFTQGDIIAVGSNYVDVHIHEGYPVEPYSRIDVIDPLTHYRKRGSQFVWGATAELLENNIVRVYQPDLPSVAEVGDMATMSTGPEGMYGSPHGLVIENCRGGIVLDGVNIYSAPGFGIFETKGVGGTILRNCNIMPGPTPKGASQQRLLCTSWDAIQHALTRTGPLVENCVVRDAGDDTWSVTWEGTFTIRSAYGNRITVNDPMAEILQAGDTIRTSLTSEYVIIDRKSGITILLDRDCPWAEGTKVYTPNRRCENFILRNNQFRNTGRVLVKASHGIIENNIIEDGHCGVIVNSESDITAIEDIVIRNNTISGSGHFMPATYSNQAGSISFAASNGGVLSPAGCFDNIIIENNSFTDVSGVNVVVTSSKNVKIKGNRFYKTGITTPNNTGSDYNIDQNTVVYLKNIETIVVDSNAVVKRGLRSLMEKFNVSGLTLLRDGVFDAVEAGNLKIKMHSEGKQLRVYPNPVSAGEAIYLEIDEDETILNSAILEIYNLSGQCVAKSQVKRVNVLPSLSSGTYIITVRNGNLVYGSNKLIVR